MRNADWKKQECIFCNPQSAIVRGERCALADLRPLTPDLRLGLQPLVESQKCLELAFFPQTCKKVSQHMVGQHWQSLTRRRLDVSVLLEQMNP